MPVRLPSIQLVITEARAIAVRFPFVMFAALAATVFGVLIVDDDLLWQRWFFPATLGIPLLLALALFAERRTWDQMRRALLGLGGLLVLLAFALLWPRWSEAVAFTRWFQLSVAFHLLVAFLPFVGYDEVNGFWQYNKALLLRFLTAGVFSAVLYVGLAIALAALDQLFGVDVEEEMYGRLWMVVAFMFNTWFFLGGVPRDLAALEQRSGYPKGIKVFAQYILVPLVTMYLAILTAYLVKVIATQDWPSGWIGYLVSSVAAVGIFALLLVYPIREREENRWIVTYSRWFFIALFPAIVMLWLAIWQRVNQYGVTEPRYFLTILSIWLAGIAVYFTLRGSRRIILIPASLCAVALVTFFGPWSAYAVSHRSQTHRLEQVLVRSELLVDGTLRPATRDLSFADRKEISAGLRYLIETHGTGSIEPWFGGSLAAIDTVGEGTRPADRGEADERTRLITAYLGVPYVGRWQRGDVEQFNYFVERSEEAISIRGYDYAVHLDGALHDTVQVADDIRLRYDSTGVALELASESGILASVPLLQLLERAQRYAGTGGDRSIPRDSLLATAENERARIAVYVTAVSGQRLEEGVALSSLSAEVYLVVR
jgi:hypothetical protein